MTKKETTIDPEVRKNALDRVLAKVGKSNVSTTDLFSDLEGRLEFASTIEDLVEVFANIDDDYSQNNQTIKKNIAKSPLAEVKKLVQEYITDICEQMKIETPFNKASEEKRIITAISSIASVSVAHESASREFSKVFDLYDTSYSNDERKMAQYLAADLRKTDSAEDMADSLLKIHDIKRELYPNISELATIKMRDAIRAYVGEYTKKLGQNNPIGYISSIKK